MKPPQAKALKPASGSFYRELLLPSKRTCRMKTKARNGSQSLIIEYQGVHVVKKGTDPRARKEM